MKILMLCEFFDPDLEFQENQILKYYRKMGHEVMLLTSTFESVFDYYASRHDASKPASRFEVHGATVWRLPYKWNLKNRLRAYRGVAELAEDFAPDLIYLHDIIPNTPELVRYKKRHPACRMIMDIHMDASNSGKGFVALKVLHGTLRRHFLNVARPHLDRIYPIVPAGFPFMRDIYGVTDAEMELLPLGADMDLINAVQARDPRDALRAELGIGPDDFLIFTGGKITPRKRTELLIEAIDTPALERAHIVIVGGVPDSEPAYSALLDAAAGKLKGRVHFAGWQKPESVYRYMHMADVAMFPASQSIMWQQSIGSGLPLVVGDTGGQDASYLNLHGNVHVLPGDRITVAGLREELELLLTDTALRTRMAEGARRTAREFLDWNVLAERTLAVSA